MKGICFAGARRYNVDVMGDLKEVDKVRLLLDYSKWVSSKKDLSIGARIFFFFLL